MELFFALLALLTVPAYFVVRADRARARRAAKEAEWRAIDRRTAEIEAERARKQAERAERERLALVQRQAQERIARQQAEHNASLQAARLRDYNASEEARRAAGVPKFGGTGRYRRGYVYILKADECEFKIGFTTRSPSGRAKAFGLPLVAIADAVDPKASEAAAHAALAQWRKGNYELFKVSLDQAVAAVANATGSRVTMY